eukprot:1157240-Pelagomonas_calceolata.AAC.3
MFAAGEKALPFSSNTERAMGTLYHGGKCPEKQVRVHNTKNGDKWLVHLVWQAFPLRVHTLLPPLADTVMLPHLAWTRTLGKPCMLQGLATWI